MEEQSPPHSGLSHSSESRAGTSEGIWVHDTADSLIVLQAAIEGRVPLLECRLRREEAVTSVCSGTLVIFHEGRSGITRWTDGLRWTNSRIHRNFLIYADRAAVALRAPPVAIPVLYTCSGQRLTNRDYLNIVECIAGTWSKKDFFRLDTLLQKTITIMTSATDIYHVVSYFRAFDIITGELVSVKSHPYFMDIRPSLAGLLHTRFRFPPSYQLDQDQVIYLAETGRSCLMCAVAFGLRGLMPLQIASLSADPTPWTPEAEQHIVWGQDPSGHNEVPELVGSACPSPLSTPSSAIATISPQVWYSVEQVQHGLEERWTPYGTAQWGAGSSNTVHRPTRFSPTVTDSPSGAAVYFHHSQLDSETHTGGGGSFSRLNVSRVD